MGIWSPLFGHARRETGGPAVGGLVRIIWFVGQLRLLVLHEGRVWLMLRRAWAELGFFSGGTRFQKILKKFPKNIQNFFKNIQKIIKKLSKNTQKFFKKFSKKFKKVSKIFKNFLKKNAKSALF